MFQLLPFHVRGSRSASFVNFNYIAWENVYFSVFRNFALFFLLLFLGFLVLQG